MEAHQETQKKLDENIAHMSETRAEFSKTRKECDDFMNQLKEDQKRQKAAEAEQSVKLMIDAQAATELENTKEKYRKTIEENETLSNQIQTMESERTDQEIQLSKLKETVEVQKREILELMSQAAEIGNYQLAFPKSL